MGARALKRKKTHARICICADAVRVLSELHRQCESKIKIEDDVKFRCKACNKLFKALNFVEKHVANKHPEEIQFEDLDRVFPSIWA